MCKRSVLTQSGKRNPYFERVIESGGATLKTAVRTDGPGHNTDRSSKQTRGGVGKMLKECQAKEDQLLEEEGRVQCLNRELAQLQKSMLSLQTKLQEEKHNTDLETVLTPGERIEKDKSSTNEKLRFLQEQLCKTKSQEQLRVSQSEEHLAAARKHQKITTNSLHELESKHGSLEADNKRPASDELTALQDHQPDQVRGSGTPDSSKTGRVCP
ncbi:hypothetical protein ACHWQZ_G016702 [Mnemiopsis leidyi]